MHFLARFAVAIVLLAVVVMCGAQVSLGSGNPTGWTNNACQCNFGASICSVSSTAYIVFNASITNCTIYVPSGSFGQVTLQLSAPYTNVTLITTSLVQKFNLNITASHFSMISNLDYSRPIWKESTLTLSANGSALNISRQSFQNCSIVVSAPLGLRISDSIFAYSSSNSGVLISSRLQRGWSNLDVTDSNFTLTNSVFSTSPSNIGSPVSVSLTRTNIVASTVCQTNSSLSTISIAESSISSSATAFQTSASAGPDVVTISSSSNIDTPLLYSGYLGSRLTITDSTVRRSLLETFANSSHTAVATITNATLIDSVLDGTRNFSGTQATFIRSDPSVTLLLSLRNQSGALFDISVYSLPSALPETSPPLLISNLQTSASSNLSSSSMLVSGSNVLAGRWIFSGTEILRSDVESSFPTLASSSTSLWEMGSANVVPLIDMSSGGMLTYRVDGGRAAFLKCQTAFILPANIAYQWSSAGSSTPINGTTYRAIFNVTNGAPVVSTSDPYGWQNFVSPDPDFPAVRTLFVRVMLPTSNATANNPAPAPSDCVGALPGPNFFCFQGTWVSQGSLTVGAGEGVVISGPSVVPGDLQIDSGASLTLVTLQDSALNVSGCVNISGTLTLVLTQQDIERLNNEPGKSRVATLISSTSTNCSAGITVSAVTIQSPPLDCQKLVVDHSNDGPSTYSAVFTLENDGACKNKSKSKTWWIVLVSVIGGIILLVAIIALLTRFYPLKKVVQPFSKRQEKPRLDTN